MQGRAGLELWNQDREATWPARRTGRLCILLADSNASGRYYYEQKSTRRQIREGGRWPLSPWCGHWPAKLEQREGGSGQSLVDGGHMTRIDPNRRMHDCLGPAGERLWRRRHPMACLGDADGGLAGPGDKQAYAESVAAILGALHR